VGKIGMMLGIPMPDHKPKKPNLKGRTRLYLPSDFVRGRGDIVIRLSIEGLTLTETPDGRIITDSIAIDGRRSYIYVRTPPGISPLHRWVRITVGRPDHDSQREVRFKITKVGPRPSDSNMYDFAIMEFDA